MVWKGLESQFGESLKYLLSFFSHLRFVLGAMLQSLRETLKKEREMWILMTKFSVCENWAKIIWKMDTKSKLQTKI